MTDEPSPLLELDSVTKTFGSLRAVDGVSLAVRAGTTLGIVGESGCGKSTLARLVLGLERPTGGRLLFEGRPYPRAARRLRPIRRRIGFVFQDPYDSLDPRFTIRKLLDEPLRAHGLPRDDERLRGLLRDTGMEGVSLDAYPAELSGGQRQRIGVARALAAEPDLVVCDEPTSALDVSVQAQILNLLLDLQERRGLTYLFISHDLEVVRRMSDEIVVMYAGAVMEHGPTARVTAAPRHPYTQMLLAALPAARPAERRPERLAAAAADPPTGERPVAAAAPEVTASTCPFAPRCPRNQARCWSERPPLAPVGDHLAACHYPVTDEREPGAAVPGNPRPAHA